MPKASESRTPPEYRYVSCRASGHEWRHQKTLVPHPWMVTVRGRISDCAGCKCVRTKWMHSDGRIWGNRYDYPPGYELGANADDGHRLKPIDWRSALVIELGFGGT